MADRKKKGTRRNVEFDRYHYVDRDIYSSSKRDPAGRGHHAAPQQRRQPPKRRKKKKRITFGKVLLMLVLIVLAGVTAVGAAALSKIQREDADTAPYVQTPADAPDWDVISSDHVTNILLLGTDRPSEGTQRSDSMMLVSLDNQSKKIRLVSFLRDTYLEIPTLGKDKLNASFAAGGASLTMQTIENNFRINIDKYVQIDVDGFCDAIDRIDGIEVVVNQQEADEMNRVMGCTLSAGKNHMRGTLAVYYSRMRAIDSDFGRTGRQRQVVECIVDKLRSMNPLECVAAVNGIIEDINIVTNLSNSEILSLTAQLPQILNYEIETKFVPYRDTYTNRTLDNGAEVLDIDLEQNCTILREFLYPPQG